METFALTEAKDKWGVIADTAMRESVTITKHGRAARVVTSVQDYKALQRLKHAQLKADIQERLTDLKQGSLSTKSGDELIRDGKARLIKSNRSGAQSHRLNPLFWT